jgi:polyphosphate kinase
MVWAVPMATPKTLTVEHFLNRELSWLAFNERVLAESTRLSLPLLERLKFQAISASNLDEFYMVRVGGLQWAKDQGLRTKELTGMTPAQQLVRIKERVTTLITRQYAILNDQLLPELRKHGIRRLTADELTAAQRSYLHDYFVEHIFPVLSPVEVDPVSPLVIPALQIVLLAHLAGFDGGEDRFVSFVLPTMLSRHVPVPDGDVGSYAYMNLEDLITLFLHLYFLGEEVIGTARFRISRNTDITVAEGANDDLATEMEEVLDARLRGATIRLEIEQGASRGLVSAIKSVVGECAHVFTIPGELDLRAYWHIVGLSGFDHLQAVAWEQQPSAQIEPGESIFSAIRRDDILLHHPYESFEPVLQLIESASTDPDVVAIKQILYRTAKNSRVIGALIKAAEAGKHVTVLVELKARFDEARNLERAEELIQAGAQIIYGVRGLKSHAKVTLVMRREAGRMMRYMHFGTGNYNETTARIYTDISYLTCRVAYGNDASAFFNTVTGRSRYQHFEKLSMAPFGVRERLLSLIDSEIDRARSGEAAEIILKMNALEDREMIEALYKASQAGVQVRLNVRGICCLRPGVKGLSERITVISVIDRYLEHARIFCFRQGGAHAVFIASADFMTRNLSKRVELLVPIEHSASRKRLVMLLEKIFEDNTQAHRLNADGSYAPVTEEGGRMRSQTYYVKEAARHAKHTQAAPDLLVPHLPAAQVRESD